MEVGHFLVGVASVVGEQAVAAIDHAQLARHRADRAPEGRDFDLRRVLRKVIVGALGALGDHQHMGRRLRVDVVIRQRMAVLAHPL